MKKLLLLISLFCTLAWSIHAQTVSSGRNYYRSGDKITKQQIEFVDPGRDGHQITWDFSRVNPIDEKYSLIYFSTIKDDTTRIVGLEHDTRYHYELKRDTLWMTGYENRMTSMVFDSAEAQLRYPFRYGDTLHTRFSGTGLYCQRVDLIARGETFVVADATGQIITPDRDTVRNVIRVRRLRSYTEIGVDSVLMKLETYSWYARGYRYPVFETVRSTIERGDSTTEHFSTSFYYPIRNIDELTADAANAISPDGNLPEEVLRNCRTLPNPVVSDLTVQYELSKDARVSFRLGDISGRSWKYVPEHTLQAGVQQQLIEMAGLPNGDYTLYITVDGQVYRKKVIKK